MKQVLMAGVLACIAAVPAKSFADYDTTKAKSCIVYIQKHADSQNQPHFAMLCDGYPILKQELSDASVLGDGTLKALEGALTTELKTRMAVKDTDTCQSADNDDVWFENCYRNDSFSK